MKEYKKILALDFEMFNTMHYWSICWIGAALSGPDMRPYYFLSRRVNPVIKKQLTGAALTFPFTREQLSDCPKFKAASEELLGLIDEETLVVGHAVENDVKMLLTACAKYRMSCPDFDFVDTGIVYGALNGQICQIGLKGLAEKFGFTFKAHHPTEDAAASLEALRLMLAGASLSLRQAMEDYSLTPGRVQHGLMRRPLAGCMGERQKEHADNYNALFDAAQEQWAAGRQQKESGKLAGKRVCIDHRLAVSQNTGQLVRWIIGCGGELTFDPASAHTVITSEIGREDKRSVFLRDFALDYGVPPSVCDGLDFCPTKITVGPRQNISYTQYLRRKYAPEDGARQGGIYCFSRAVEGRRDFEDLAGRLLKRGGRLSGLVGERTVYVIGDSASPESGLPDIKAREYLRLKRTGKGRLMTLSLLEAAIEEDRL